MNDPLASLPSLVLLSGIETGRRIPLTTGAKAVIGRSLEADLTFPDEPSLSRFHARIEYSGDQYTITDLGSVNGTQINGKDIPQQQPTPLAHRDVITCGELELRFELPEGQRAAAGSRTMVMTRPEDLEALPRVRAILATESRPVEGEEISAPPAPNVAPAAEMPERDVMAEEQGAPPGDEAPVAIAEAGPAREEDLGAVVAPAAEEAAASAAAHAHGQEAAQVELPAAEAELVPARDAPFTVEETVIAALTPETSAPEVVSPVATPEPAPSTAAPEEAVPFTGVSETAEIGPPPAVAEAPLPEPVPVQHALTALEEVVGALPLFRGLSPDELRSLTQSMTQREFAPGTEIVRQGEEGLSLYIVLSGEVRVQRAGPGGDLDLASIGPGGFFGEMTLLDGEPRSATVRAVTPVRCALLPRWGLEATIRQNPSVAMEMLAVLSRRLRATEGLLTA
jgi:hypothetical protein